LRYALRSITTHAPWIRNIFIVTNGQVPAWLDRSAPGVKIVTHEELFPDRACLPTYNSNAIESVLYNIAGLSDNFIYFNDDFFFGRNVTIEDFIDPALGHKLFMESRRMPKDMTDRSMIAHSWAFNNALLEDRVSRNRTRNMFAHTPQIYNKHILNEICLVWREDFERTRRNRFRTAFDAAFRVLYTYYVGEQKRKIISFGDTSEFGTIVELTSEDYAFLKIGDRDANYHEEVARALRARPKFICVNDEIPDGSSEIEQRVAIELMKRLLDTLYPRPSRFELTAQPARPRAPSTRCAPASSWDAQKGRAAEVRWRESVAVSGKMSRSLAGAWHEIESSGVWSGAPSASLWLKEIGRAHV
jgi:hypothetical protein